MANNKNITYDQLQATLNRIKTELDKKANSSHGTHLTLGTGSGNAYRGDYGNTAYTHSQAAHAPSNAQKNSDITKAEIEAKLTGNITTHTHDTYAPIDSPNFTTAISMGRKSNSSVGTNSVAFGYSVTASGNYSHAEGYGTTASGVSSHTEGSSTEATGSYSHAEGSYAKAQNIGAHAEGYYTVASGEYSHAEGSQTYATEKNAHTEGYQTRANGEYSHAEGLWTTASGKAQHVQGKYNIADTEGKYAHIIGNGEYNNGYIYSNAHTLDWDGNAWFAGNITVGADEKQLATEEYVDDLMTGHTHSVMSVDDTRNVDSTPSEYTQGLHVEFKAGNTLKLNGYTGLITFKQWIDWSGGKASQIGFTNGTISFRSGNQDGWSGWKQIAFTDSNISGNAATASKADTATTATKIAVARILTIGGTGKTFDGSGNVSWSLSEIGAYSATGGRLNGDIEIPAANRITIGNSKFTETGIALGALTNQAQNTSLAIGDTSIATGMFSCAIGRWVRALGYASSAFGRNIVAFGDQAHAEGNSDSNTGGLFDWTTVTANDVYEKHSTSSTRFGIAFGTSSHSEGHNCAAIGHSSHAEGNATVTNNSYAHAEGNATKALGIASHAEGSTTTASGSYSHAEGYNTKASYSTAHAEGYQTEACNSNAHAEGENSIASGMISHAEGNYTIARGGAQHTQGRFNIEDTANKYAHIVGNGQNNDNRSNAHTVEWNGNAVFAGSCTATSHPTTSDRTLKENINYISNASTINDESITLDECYSFIKNDLAVATYNYKEDDESRLKIGFIAQDLLYNADQTDNKIGQLIIDNFQGTDMGKGENKLTYDSNNLFGVMLATMQMMANKIETLEKEVEDLKNHSNK